ncbi:MAG: DUF4268 domain-containing protein [Fimbriimonadaceae bacterium]
MATKRRLGRLERVPLREAWRHEANDFTPWLAEPENLDLLAQALGLGELVPMATEHAVGDFKVDILCTDGEDRVIIENQLDKTDHGHLGQILACAAGVGARKVVWIAESFRPEHVAALQFLNENTTEDLGFFGVEIRLWRIGDSPPAPEFEVVARPNEWTRAGREQARAAAEASPTRQMQQRLWMALVEHLAKEAPHIRPQRPRPQFWLTVRIGRSGFELNAIANSRDRRIGVELYIDSPQAKEHYASLHAQREQIEADLGYGLDWQELPEARAVRIAVWREDSPLDEETRWPEYCEWFTRRLVEMDAVFRPLVRALP